MKVSFLQIIIYLGFSISLLTLMAFFYALGMLMATSCSVMGNK